MSNRGGRKQQKISKSQNRLFLRKQGQGEGGGGGGEGLVGIAKDEDLLNGSHQPGEQFIKGGGDEKKDSEKKQIRFFGKRGAMKENLLRRDRRLNRIQENIMSAHGTLIRQAYLNAGRERWGRSLVN